MPEYIEREKAIKKMCEGCNIDFSDEPCEPYDCRLHRGLREMPAADVVEVVRCKDCKFYETLYCAMDDIYSLSDNDFCSYGIKKEGAEE